MPDPTCRRPVVAVFLGLLTASGAAAQGIDADTLKRYGGSYAVDCGRPGTPRMRVAADALSVEQGNQRMTGRNAMSAYGFFGNSPPPRDFQVALLSEVRGGPQMIFMVYADRAGPYIRLDGEPKMRAALGNALMAGRYRRCDGAAPVATAAPLTAPEPVPRGCSDHNAVFLYSAAQQQVLGLVQQRGAKSLVGAPSAAQAAQLDRLWQAEWRQ